MPQLQIQRYGQILERMISRVVARTDLSDVVDTSSFKHVLAATARELDEAYYQMARLTAVFNLDDAAGDDLDERAKDVQPGTLERISAVRSIGTVVFSRKTNTGLTVTIPAGTVVKTSDGKIFKTTIQTQISGTSPQQIAGHGVGRDSALTSAIADTPGSAGNVPAGTIIKFGSKPPGVDEVTNTVAFIQGRDKESDDAFRSRIKSFIASLARSTVEALEFLVLGATDPVSGKQVIFSHVFEDPLDRGNVIVYIDDGAGTASDTVQVLGENVTQGLSGPPANSAVGGEEFLYLDFSPVDLGAPFTLTSSIRSTLTLGVDYFFNPASGRIYFTPALVTGEVITADYTRFINLIAYVQKVIDGDPLDRENFPGIRAAGILVRVLSPVVVAPTVEGTLVLADGADRPTAIAAAELAIQNYINNRGISGDIIRNALIDLIMEIENVTDVELTIPSTNIPILDNEISRITSANINLS